MTTFRTCRLCSVLGVTFLPMVYRHLALHVCSSVTPDRWLLGRFGTSFFLSFDSNSTLKSTTRSTFLYVRTYCHFFLCMNFYRFCYIFGDWFRAAHMGSYRGHFQMTLIGTWSCTHPWRSLCILREGRTVFLQSNL